MKRRLGPILLVVGIVYGTCAWAQTDTSAPDTGAPTQPGPKPAYTYPDTSPSLDFLSGSVENSSITLGISTGFSYDSNAYSSPNTSQNSWWMFTVTPSIRIQQFRPKLSWNVSYAGGYQQRFQQNVPTAQNTTYFSQHAGGGFLWQMAPHWQLNGSDSFTYSANPFDSYLTTPGTPTLNNPNPVTYYPLTQYTQNFAVLTLTDQLTKRDTLSFSGTANLRDTSTYNLATTVPFYNLISYGGRAAYSHQFSQRLSLGAGYNYNSLEFGKGQQRSGIQSVTMTVDYLIRPNMTISGWVGPEHTGTQTTFLGIKLPHSSLWSTSLGANFGWRGRRNSAGAGFSRGVTDGGGITATSQVTTVNGSYRRMITPKMDGSLGAQYFHSVSTTTSIRSFDNYSFSASLSYKLARSLNASVRYLYLHQTQSNAFLINPGTYDANIVGVSISYTWTHPLGW